MRTKDYRRHQEEKKKRKVVKDYDKWWWGDETPRMIGINIGKKKRYKKEETKFKDTYIIQI